MEKSYKVIGYQKLLHHLFTSICKTCKNRIKKVRNNKPNYSLKFFSEVSSVVTWERKQNYFAIILWQTTDFVHDTPILFLLITINLMQLYQQGPVDLIYYAYLTQQLRQTSGSHSLSAAKQGHWRLLHWLLAQWQPRNLFLQLLGHLYERSKVTVDEKTINKISQVWEVDKCLEL